MIACLNINDPAVKNMIAAIGMDEAKLVASGAIGNKLGEELTKKYRDKPTVISYYIDSFRSDFLGQYTPESRHSDGSVKIEVLEALLESVGINSLEDATSTAVVRQVAPSINSVRDVKSATMPVSVKKVSGNLVMSVHTLAKPLKELAHAIVDLNVSVANNQVSPLRSIVRLLEGSNVVREDLPSATQDYNDAKFIGDALTMGDKAFNEGDPKGDIWRQTRDQWINKAAYKLGMTSEALSELSTMYLDEVQEGLDNNDSVIAGFSVSDRPTVTDTSDVTKVLDEIKAIIKDRLSKSAVSSKQTKLVIDAANGTARNMPLFELLATLSSLNTYAWYINDAVSKQLENARALSSPATLDEIMRYKDALAIFDALPIIRSFLEQNPEFQELVKLTKSERMLDSATSNVAKAKDKISEIAKIRIVNEYSHLLTNIVEDFRRDITADLKKTNPSLEGEELEKAVEIRMEASKDRIEARQRARMNELTKFMPQDITGVDARLDPRSANNEFIQIAVELADLKDKRVRDATIKARDVIIPLTEKFQRDNAGKTVSEMYSPMIEDVIETNLDGSIKLDENGNIKKSKGKSNYYVGEYYRAVSDRVYTLLNKQNDLNSEGIDEELALYGKTVNGVFIISDKFKNPQYEALVNRNDSTSELYNALINYNTLADSLLPAYQQLNGKLPSIEKNDKEMVQEFGLGAAAKNAALNVVRVRNSEEGEYAPFGTNLGLVPVRYRGKIDNELISHDLATTTLENYNSSVNYHETSMIRPDIVFMKEIMKEAKFGDTNAMFSSTRQKVVKNTKRDYKTGDENNYRYVVVTDKKSGKKYTYDAYLKEGVNTNALKLMEFLITNRLYDVKSTDSPKVAKAAKVVAKATSSIYLFGNLPAATKNFVMGHLNNVFESAYNPYVTLKSLAKAEGKYLATIPRFLHDLTQKRPASKEGLMFEKFNVYQDYRPVGDLGLSERDPLSKVYGSKYANFMYSGGEHMISGTLAFSIFDSYKVKGKDGKKVSIFEAYEEKNGELVVKEGYTIDEKTEFEVERIIEDARRRAQGNYSTQNQFEFQQTWYGSMIGQMRKWIASGTKARFRGIGNVLNADMQDVSGKFGYYNRASKQYEEGTYASTMRFVLGAINDDLRHLRVGMAVSKSWEQLSPQQRRGIARVAVDLAAIATLSVLAGIMHKWALDEDDEEERRRKFFALYIVAGAASELKFYYNPAEATRLLKSPGVVLPLIDNALSALSQLLTDPTEVFTTGKNADESKLGYAIKGFVPPRYGIPGLYEGSKTVEESVQSMFKY